MASRSSWLAPLASFFACCRLMYCIISSSPATSSSSTVGAGLGVLLRMFWVLGVVAYRGCSSDDGKEYAAINDEDSDDDDEDNQEFQLSSDKLGLITGPGSEDVDEAGVVDGPVYDSELLLMPEEKRKIIEEVLLMNAMSRKLVDEA